MALPTTTGALIRHGAMAASILAILSCRPPTEMTIDISVDFPCNALTGAELTLVVVTDDDELGGVPGFFRCNLDGTACQLADVSAGQGNNSGGHSGVVIDAVAQKVYAVTDYGAGALSKAWLFRFNLDGTGASSTEMSVGHANFGGTAPAVVRGRT